MVGSDQEQTIFILGLKLDHICENLFVAIGRLNVMCLSLDNKRNQSINENQSYGCAKREGLSKLQPVQHGRMGRDLLEVECITMKYLPLMDAKVSYYVFSISVVLLHFCTTISLCVISNDNLSQYVCMLDLPSHYSST